MVTLRGSTGKSASCLGTKSDSAAEAKRRERRPGYDRGEPLDVLADTMARITYSIDLHRVWQA